MPAKGQLSLMTPKTSISKPSEAPIVPALLGGWGAEVRELSDAASALALADAERPDALVVDLHLAGGRSGLEVVERLAGVPVCVVSAAPPEALAALRARGLLVLRKPVEAVRLRAALDHLLGA